MKNDQSDIEVKDLCLLTNAFYIATFERAHPEIDFIGIKNFARDNNTCPLIPPTDEMSYLSAEEYESLISADRTIRRIANSVEKDTLLTEEHMNAIYLHMMLTHNIRLAAHIRKNGSYEISRHAPDTLTSPAALSSLEKYGMNLLHAIALQSKAIKLTPA